MCSHVLNKGVHSRYLTKEAWMVRFLNRYSLLYEAGRRACHPERREGWLGCTLCRTLDGPFGVFELCNGVAATLGDA